MENKAKLFVDGKCPDASDLFLYVKVKLPPSEIRRIEAHLISCPLCNAAVDGMHHISGMYKINHAVKSNPYKSANLKWWLGGFSVVVIALVFYFYENDHQKQNILSPEINSVSTLSDSNFTANSNTPAMDESSFVDSSSAVNQPERKELSSNADSIIPKEEYPVINNKTDSLKADSVPVIKRADRPNIPSTVNGFPVKYIYDLKVIDYNDVYEAVDIRHAAVRNIPANKENVKSNIRFAVDMDTSRSEEVLKKALLNFSFNENKKTIDLLNQLLKVFPDDQNAQFYSGVSYYKMNDNAKAAQLFEKVLTHKGTVFTEEAEWYLALSLLKNHKEKEGRTLLEKIVSAGGFYAPNAQQKLNGK